jgi:hypothetical protein
MTQKTEQLDQQVLDQIRELNSRRNTLVTTFGQIYIRRQELDAEFEKLAELEEEASLSFKNTGEQLKTIFDELGERYNRGSLDINNGTITYMIDETVETSETNE